MKKHILGGILALLCWLPFSLRAEYVYHPQTKAAANPQQPSSSLTAEWHQPVQALEAPHLQIQVITSSGMKRGLYPFIWLAHSFTNHSVTPGPFYPYAFIRVPSKAYLFFIYPSHNFW